MRLTDRYFVCCRADISNDAAWFQTLPPLGEYPGMRIKAKGKTVDATIVIDEEALVRCLAAFRDMQVRENFNGILVDREHFSLDLDKPSDAMAWARDMQARDDGIWTRWDFTPPGREAWETKVLVSRSPVMDLEDLGNGRYRPVRITSIAMTNTPQFTSLSTLAAARAAEDSTGTACRALTQQGDPTMKKLLALLGLPETATEDEACAAVQVMIDRATAADAEMKKAQAACRKAACDAFFSKHKDSIADEAKFRAAYEKNPETTEEVFGSFRAVPPAQAPRIDARSAQTPGAGAETVTLAGYRAMPAGKAKDEFLARHGETLLRLERDESK